MLIVHKQAVALQRSANLQHVFEKVSQSATVKCFCKNNMNYTVSNFSILMNQTCMVLEMFLFLLSVIYPKHPKHCPQSAGRMRAGTYQQIRKGIP